MRAPFTSASLTRASSTRASSTRVSSTRVSSAHASVRSRSRGEGVPALHGSLPASALRVPSALRAMSALRVKSAPRVPSLYVAAAVATAAATVASLTMTPASGVAARTVVAESARPYLVTARDRAAARDLVGEVRWRVRRYYTAALPGFATWLSAAEVDELRADPRVRAVEPDLPTRPLRDRRAVPSGVVSAGDVAVGGGVTVYVVDSGLDAGREEFGDRAWHAFDATGGTGDDCTGHGTRAARLAAGREHGVAPRAGIASVRVLGCGATGSLSDTVAGLDWVRRHARRPAVALLGVTVAPPAVPNDGAPARRASAKARTTGSPALDTAVRRLARSGVPVTAGPREAGAAIRNLRPRDPEPRERDLHDLGLHPATWPFTPTSWPKWTAGTVAIRQNPSRALRTGGV
ncbi:MULTISPECIES: protease inhibitor I9 family protein [unclassified Nonomuraea]|uniref:protease inhibitor I9 family protein n=1 Tax=unclassified Nonomuraea TaxID=2593643 RepID=UPI0033EA069D